MKLIFDGLLHDNSNNTLKAFGEYLDVNVVKFNNALSTYRLFKTINPNTRRALYRQGITEMLYNITNSIGYYDDYLQHRSPVSMYVVERLIEILGRRSSRFAEPGEIALFILEQLAEKFPKNSNICIAFFNDKEMRTLLSGNNSYNIPDYTVKRSILSKLNREYQAMVPYSSIRLVNTLYKEAYDLLKNNKKRQCQLTQIDLFPDRYFRKIEDTVNKVVIPHPILAILDIDDVLVDYDDPGASLLRKRKYNEFFIKDCRKYLSEGHLDENFNAVFSYLNNYLNGLAYDTPEASKMTVVILTARCVEDDKSFLRMLGNEMSDKIVNMEEAFFDKNLNLLSVPPSPYRGGTAFKSYAIRLLADRLKEKFSGVPNGLIFLDDRIKYAKGAFNTLATNKNRQVSMVYEKIGKNNIYSISSFSR